MYKSFNRAWVFLSSWRNEAGLLHAQAKMKFPARAARRFDKQDVADQIKQSFFQLRVALVRGQRSKMAFNVPLRRKFRLE